MSAEVPVPNSGAADEESTDTILDRLQRRPRIRRLADFGARHRNLVAAAFFFGGFLWDLLTLRRADAWLDNLLLASYLSALTALIVLTARVEFGDRPSGNRDRRLLRFRTVLRDATQFLMGALFSASVVFYGQSASLGRTSVYVVVLIALLVANEFVHRRRFNLTLLIALYFLAAASYLILLLPVLLLRVDFASFIGAGITGALLSAGLVWYVDTRCALPGRLTRTKAVAAVGGLFALLNVFYLTNLIPPVPLAMKYGGVFHDVYRSGEAYRLTYEAPPWHRFWSQTSDPFRHVEGEPVYCFAAVFAPTDLRERIYHAWQYRDERRGEWVETDRIPYEVVGGRARGYRGFTYKRTVHVGPWRVLVEDERGFVLGKVTFDIVPVDSVTAPMKTRLYY